MSEIKEIPDGPGYWENGNHHLVYVVKHENKLFYVSGLGDLIQITKESDIWKLKREGPYTYYKNQYEATQILESNLQLPNARGFLTDREGHLWFMGGPSAHKYLIDENGNIHDLQNSEEVKKVREYAPFSPTLDYLYVKLAVEDLHNNSYEHRRWEES